jgi:hypothetical protein
MRDNREDKRQITNQILNYMRDGIRHSVKGIQQHLGLDNPTGRGLVMKALAKMLHEGQIVMDGAMYRIPPDRRCTGKWHEGTAQEKPCGRLTVEGTDRCHNHPRQE